MFPLRPLGLFLAVMAVFILFQGVMLLAVPEGWSQVSIIATQLIVILGGALVYRIHFSREDTRWPALGRLGMGPWACIAVVVAAVSLGMLANAVGALTVYIFPALEPMAEAYQQEIETLLLPDEMYAQVLGAIGVAAVAPVAEEVLFRGTILPEQRREQIAVSAILLNGILFSLMHLNPVAFVSLAIVGCYFAHITVRSGSLWPAIIGHGVLNLVNGVILLRVVDDVPGPEEVELTEIAVGLVVLVPVTALLWWLSAKLIGEGDDPA